MREDTCKGYKLREITPADNAALAVLIRYNLKKHGLDIPGTAYFDTCLDDLFSFYANRIGCGYYVLVDDNDKVLGGIGFDRFGEISGRAELQKMYLDDTVKGNGLGYCLIRFVEARMREAGYSESYLETHSNLQAAIHVYEKLGYTRVERPKEVGHSTMDHFYIKTLCGCSA